MRVSSLRLPVPKMVVVGMVAIENVIMSDQPVSWVYLFAKVLLLPSSRFWHCSRNWYTDSVDFICHLSYFTCSLFWVPAGVFHNWNMSRGVMVWKRAVQGCGILRKMNRGR